MMKAIGFLTLAAVLSLGAAEPFPNPSMIHRYVGSDTNETWQGVVNNGVVWKRGGGTVTMPAPALNGGGRLNVTAGDVALNLDAAPTVPTLTPNILNKIKLWLDPGVNIVVEDGLVTKWFDRRETNITDEVASYVYPYASSKFHWMTPAPADDRRPSFVASGPNLNGAYLDFGAYGANSCKWLCITNTGRAGGLVYAREVFVVCVRRDGHPHYGFTMFSSCRGDAGQNRPRPAWVGGPSNSRLWGSTENTRADKGNTRLDRSPVWGGFLQIQDNAWHLVSTRLPNSADQECALNQIGLDRDLTSSCGGFCLAEVIMFEQRLSEFDRMRVEDYLWKKWMGSRQTSIGSVAIAAGSKVSAATSSDVTGALSGGGTFEKSGTGTVTLVNDGFSGTVVLNSGNIRSENLPFAVKSGGQTLSVGLQGVVTRTDGVAANTFVKSGSGQLVVASLPATTTVQVTTGTLRITPPTASAEFLAPAVFSNANFEAFNAAYAWNAGGTSDTGLAITNGNWVFNRSGRSGVNLVMILNKSTYHNNDGNWYLYPEDSYGLGYEGEKFLYICRGQATGTFTIPASGMYRLVYQVGARNTSSLKRMNLMIDGVTVREVTSFDHLSWMRYEVALPFLAAGEHSVTFADVDSNNADTILFDDIKILPVEARADVPISVEIANPGFEESRANVASKDYAFKPIVANCTGWTMEDIQNTFAGSLIMRRWFDGVTDADHGLLAWPDEMADGFLCAQLYGAARPISQTVTLPSAGRYRLTFQLAKRCGLSPQLVIVSIGDTVVKKVWVRHDDWKRYEAIFDMAEGGDKTLTFAGGAATVNNNVYTTGSAWLDDVALERVSETIPGNLVSNGGFETVGGGWTYSTCSNMSATVTGWYNSLTNSPPMGADCVFMSGHDLADGDLRQDVTFPAAGRYELSFRVRRFRANPFGDDSNVSRLYVMLGDNMIWDSYVLRHEDECVIKQPFTVAEAGTYRLNFHTSFGDFRRGYALLDDVAIVAAPAAARTDLADYIPENIELDVANGAKLNLDFDGVAVVRGIRYNGRRLVGEISHDTCPAWVMGRGVLSAAPRGTVIMFR